MSRLHLYYRYVSYSTKPGITGRNQPETSDVSESDDTLDLIADAVHRMSHQVAFIHAEFSRWAPVLEAFERGGMLAARTAAKRARSAAGGAGGLRSQRRAGLRTRRMPFQPGRPAG